MKKVSDNLKKAIVSKIEMIPGTTIESNFGQLKVYEGSEKFSSTAFRSEHPDMYEEYKQLSDPSLRRVGRANIVARQDVARTITSVSKTPSNVRSLIVQREEAQNA